MQLLFSLVFTTSSDFIVCTDPIPSSSYCLPVIIRQLRYFEQSCARLLAPLSRGTCRIYIYLWTQTGPGIRVGGRCLQPYLTESTKLVSATVVHHQSSSCSIPWPTFGMERIYCQQSVVFHCDFTLHFWLLMRLCNFALVGPYLFPLWQGNFFHLSIRFLVIVILDCYNTVNISDANLNMCGSVSGLCLWICSTISCLGW